MPAVILIERKDMNEHGQQRTEPRYSLEAANEVLWTKSVNDSNHPQMARKIS